MKIAPASSPTSIDRSSQGRARRRGTAAHVGEIGQCVVQGGETPRILPVFLKRAHEDVDQIRPRPKVVDDAAQQRPNGALVSGLHPRARR